MTELNITRFFTEAAPMDYSASQAEIGQDAGPTTWRQALEDAPDYADLLDTDDKRAAFRKFVRSSGGWSQAEIDSWSDAELTALLMQWIAGDIREGGLDSETADWDAYAKDAEDGQVSGRIYRGDDGAIYFSISE